MAGTYKTVINDLPVIPLPDLGYQYGDGRDLAYSFMLAQETKGDPVGGGEHDNSALGDKGGLTKFGVAQNYWPGVDVKGLTLKTALDFYNQNFWNGMFLDQVNEPVVQAVLFDYMMNSPRAATKAAQEIVRPVGDQMFGSFAVDGAMGRVDATGLRHSNTAAAINRFVQLHGPEEFIARFNDRRRSNYYASKDKAFKKGWINRTNELEAFLISNPFPNRAAPSGLDEQLYLALTNSPSWVFSNQQILP